MTSFRNIALALALTTVLAVSGCSSKDSGTTTGAPTSNGGTSGSGGNGGGGGLGGNTTVGNATGEEFKCTANPGDVVGAGGTNVATVSGCNFVTLSGDAVYVSEDIPAGCDSLFDANGDGQFDPGAPETGKTYTSGTVLAMGCGATNAQGQGTIHVRYI